MPAKLYRKKPIAVQAFRVGHDEVPDWALGRKDFVIFSLGSDTYAEVHTLEGIMKCYLGDYIIKGAIGEIYPCRADVFEDTYVPNEVECEDSIYRTVLHKIYSAIRTGDQVKLKAILDLLFVWGQTFESNDFSIQEIKKSCHMVLSNISKL